jgi:glycosyltransferase involved in cell wall biosynthesis
VTIDEIVPIMANANMGIIPKRGGGFGGEAFSTKTLEFMNLKVPLILSRTRVDQYYFNDSCVRFFEPGNVDDLAAAMMALIKDENLRKRLSENALGFAQENKWESKKQIYLDLVDDLCKDRCQRPPPRQQAPQLKRDIRRKSPPFKRVSQTVGNYGIHHPFHDSQP